MMRLHEGSATVREGVEIRRATPDDRDVLFDVWLRSVRVTHTFVSEADIQSFMPLVRDYLASSGTEFWVLYDVEGAVMGFMGIAGSKMESLFLTPEFQGRGGGRRLVEHARALHGELTVDVNGAEHGGCRLLQGVRVRRRRAIRTGRDGPSVSAASYAARATSKDPALTSHAG
jgi:putative acetyltransferase